MLSLWKCSVVHCRSVTGRVLQCGVLVATDTLLEIVCLSLHFPLEPPPFGLYAHASGGVASGFLVMA